MKKTIVKTSLAPEAVGTYSQGVCAAGTFYFSGQIGLNPETMKLQSDFSSQLKQILHNIDGLLKSQNLSRENIIKTSIFLIDLDKFSEVNDSYLEYFNAPFPARSCVEVPALPKGAEIEIEVIAVS